MARLSTSRKFSPLAAIFGLGLGLFSSCVDTKAPPSTTPEVGASPNVVVSPVVASSTEPPQPTTIVANDKTPGLEPSPDTSHLAKNLLENQGTPALDVEALSPAPKLHADIEASLIQPFLENASVSISVIDVNTGEQLYAKNPQTPLNPASNVKLFTTAAALALLGPEHRFYTRVFVKADRYTRDSIEGDIYIKGDGDPQLVTANLYELAAGLYAAGLRKITGGIVVDSSRFDADGLPPGFEQKDEFASYRAPSGATSVNFNTYVLRVRPGQAPGNSPVAAINPRVASVTIDNKAKTVSGRRNRLQVAVETNDAGKTVVTLSGKIGASARNGQYRYPVTDPSRYAGETFATVLRQAGIRVGRKKIRIGVVPSDAKQIGQHQSQALSVHLHAINKASNNFMAELLLRSFAPQTGSTSDEALVQFRQTIQGLGVSIEGMSLGNGSGLYTNNLASSDHVTQLLAAMHHDFRYRADFMASLSIMGKDGTSKSRLSNTPLSGWVRAKTGTLDGVSALSGYIGHKSGSILAFSILMNDLGRWRASQARDVQNEIVQHLGSYLQAKQPEEVPAPGASESEIAPNNASIDSGHTTLPASH